MYTILRGKNTGLYGQEIDFAQRLIQTPSTSLKESGVADCIEREMQDIGYDQVHRDDFGNVIGTMLGHEAAPTILLNSHMDTVNPYTGGVWQAPPYNGKVDGDQLHGEGAADCKGGLAAQVYTGALLQRSLLPLRGNLVVTATVAEENGASIGMRGLLEHTLPELGLMPTYAILGEPTSLGIYYGHDGWMEVDICIDGSATETLRDATRTITEDYTETCTLPSWTEIREVGPILHAGSGRSCQTLHMAHRVVEGKQATAVLEEIDHHVQLAVRPLPDIHAAVAVHKEKQRLQNGRMVTVRHTSNAWTTDPFNRLIERARQALAAADCEVRTGKWKLGRLGMGTAGAMLVNEFGIPTIGYGPGNEDQAHASDEHVACSDIQQAVYGTASIVHALIGVPVCGWTTDEI
ncbi:M20 family metallopeptidase [Pontiella sulfatireligans]|uniref:Succinyl-diaminopimelate desuccinylase DapE n=1 Tax=Pontiella sulfatireligans TaxID=2750658 RepID=A0A6C2UKV9_9BACT|nr:M20/M25/M40 family metallo-hydrolase [Pontiella sulfatireligans]VGO19934.1 Putative succinyl-diaminopimelate desuccinylase DapE [Pontiella sulfatireligans]